MRRMRVLMVIGIFGALFWDALAEGAPPATVVVFGDSITAGGALPAAERSQLWVALVETHSSGRLKMVNEGKGGRPTNSFREFEVMLGRHPRVDVLMLALGMNDSRDITPECVPKAVANLRKMLELARQNYGQGLRVLVASPTNIRKDALVATKPIAEQRAAKLRELGSAFQRLAADTDARFVNLYGVVPETSLSHDGVHPDGAGNAPLAQVLLPVLLELAGAEPK
ncbi:MAG: hydrolase [Verrucomicrobiaceae bacterium]|nr:hydrolase [Verrucomicrobiaceae bacterium]